MCDGFIEVTMKPVERKTPEPTILETTKPIPVHIPKRFFRVELIVLLKGSPESSGWLQCP